MLPYSLLFRPLRNHLRWAQQPWFWPAPPADGQAIGNRQPLFPYAFRPGGFWQPQQISLQPAAADVALPNAPVLMPYTFRKGGYWQTQKRWGVQSPADVAQPSAPLLRAYVFRRGGLWSLSKVVASGQGANPPIFTPYMPPPIGSPSGEVFGSANYSPMGSPGGEVPGQTLPAPIGTPTQN